MSRKPLGIRSLWDLAAAVISLLLYLNFLVIAVLCAAAVGMMLLDPVPAVCTAIFLLLGILCHFVTRHRTGKLWRRLLLGGIAANFLMIGFYVFMAAAVVMAWQ